MLSIFLYEISSLELNLLMIYHSVHTYLDMINHYLYSYPFYGGMLSGIKPY